MSNNGGKFAAFSQEAESRKAFALQKDNGLSGNSQIPHDMWRRLIPIALEYDRGLGAMATIYTYLLTHVNGERENDRYMSAWTSVDRIAKETGVGKNRIAPISDALEAVGLIRTTYDYTSNKRDKLYYPLYYSTLSDDEIHANMAEWKRQMDEKKAREKAARELRKAADKGQSLNSDLGQSLNSDLGQSLNSDLGQSLNSDGNNNKRNNNEHNNNKQNIQPIAYAICLT